MKKISLVELSQMEVKPNKIKYKGNFYILKRGEYWLEGSEVCNLQDIELYELNLPLIEIEEEPILTDEEKEYIKMCVKFSKHSIKYVSYDNRTKYLDFHETEDEDEYCGTTFLDNSVSLEDGYFSNMEHARKYSLEELEIEVE